MPQPVAAASFSPGGPATAVTRAVLQLETLRGALAALPLPDRTRAALQEGDASRPVEVLLRDAQLTIRVGGLRYALPPAAAQLVAPLLDAAPQARGPAAAAPDGSSDRAADTRSPMLGRTASVDPAASPAADLAASTNGAAAAQPGSPLVAASSPAGVDSRANFEAATLDSNLLARTLHDATPAQQGARAASPASAASAASATSKSAADGPAISPPAASSMTHAGAVSAAPQPRAAIEFRREAPRRGPYAPARGAQPTWTAQLRLELPRLGNVRVAIRLVGDSLAATVDGDAPVALRDALPQLSSALGARGLNVVSLAIPKSAPASRPDAAAVAPSVPDAT